MKTKTKNFEGITEKFGRSKNFDETKKSLDWDPLKAEKCFQGKNDKFVLQDKNDDLHLQKKNKLTLNAFDDKRKNINNIETCHVLEINYARQTVSTQSFHHCS